MENISEVDQMELPAGFRFHPTDEELITHYLYPKFCNTNFVATAIGEVDLNKVEPWDLPWRAKMGEKEWYFFSVRDRKYPTGLRTNRATEAGYWKATGKDKEIYRAKKLVGMKKTLVFCKGRAPKGDKSDWVMHEFRLEGEYCITNPPKTSKNEWVISRIFHKSSGGKKIHTSGLVRHGNFGDQLHNPDLPVLLDVTVAETSHVSCFSQELDDTKTGEQMLSPSYSSIFSPKTPNSGPLFSTQNSLQLPVSLLMQEPSFLRFLQGENEPETGTKQSHITDFSHEIGGMSTHISSVVSNREMGQSIYEEQEYPITSSGPTDCLWNYCI